MVTNGQKEHSCCNKMKLCEMACQQTLRFTPKVYFLLAAGGNSHADCDAAVWVGWPCKMTVRECKNQHPQFDLHSQLRRRIATHLAASPSPTSRWWSDGQRKATPPPLPSFPYHLDHLSFGCNRHSPLKTRKSEAEIFWKSIHFRGINSIFCDHYIKYYQRESRINSYLFYKHACCISMWLRRYE